MKKVVCLFTLFALSFAAFSKSVSVTTAHTIAFNFYSTRVPSVTAEDLQCAYTAQSVVGGVAVNDFYIFNLTTAPGFIIVSADDRVLPILAYSTESNFIADKKNPEFWYWLDHFKAQINYVISNNIPASDYIAAKWNNMANGGLNRTMTTAVAPMLRSLWDQENPSGTELTYNADCPDDHASNPSDTGRTVTGCVATAMSQVMKYWNWPDTGVGSVTYTQRPDPDGIPAQTANFAVAYHFDSMQIPEVTTPNQYVALLMYYAGVSVYMDYGTYNEDGSAAYVTEGMSPRANECAEYALVNYWRYPSAKGYARSGYSDAAWQDTMLNEMNAHRPVIYAGMDTGRIGGHCFVMDGYELDTFFHFNWGWGGYANCYTLLSNIAAPAAGYMFNNDQQAIIRIIPDTPSGVTTGISSTVAARSIVVYPDPAKDRINIDLLGKTADDISICDINGRVVLHGTQATFDIAGLSNGMYFIKVTADGGVFTEKFIVSR